jgi:hypothetical protein
VDLNTTDNTARLSYLNTLFKSLIQKKFNIRTQLTIIRTDNIQSDSKLLGDFLAFNIASKPLKLKQTIKRSLSF